MFSLSQDEMSVRDFYLRIKLFQDKLTVDPKIQCCFK